MRKTKESSIATLCEARSRDDIFKSCLTAEHVLLVISNSLSTHTLVESSIVLITILVKSGRESSSIFTGARRESVGL